LFAVSCKINTSDNAAFVQLTKDPRAEAVLATVAIQMQQTNGFQKVQALLKELLDSARENLHHNNMLFRQAQGRCDIYNHKLAEKDDYLASLVDSLNAEKITVEDATTRAGDAITARTELISSYSALLSAEEERFKAEGDFYSGIETTVADAQIALDELLASLSSNDEVAVSFVQTNVKKVTNAYQKVFNLNIDMPTAFIQMSIDNEAAKHRIVSWLQDIKMTFSTMVDEIKSAAETRSANSEGFKNTINTINDALRAENANITELKEKYEELVKEYGSNIEQFSGFKATNLENLHENEAYCQKESENYERVKKGSEENVNIYTELMDYFMENYRKVSKLINDKYKKLD
jgi:ABC-type transporter Mla subunit MlaD